MKKQRKFISMILAFILFCSSINVNATGYVSNNGIMTDETASSQAIYLDSEVSPSEISNISGSVYSVNEIYKLPPLPEDFNYKNCIVAWYPLTNSFKFVMQRDFRLKTRIVRC